MVKNEKEWQEVRLGDICIINYGKGLIKSKVIKGHIPVYSSSGITNYHNNSLVNSKGIIIGRKGNAGSVFYSKVPFFCIDTTFYITENKNYDLNFLYYNLISLNLTNYITGTAVPGITRRDLYSINTKLPPLEEQKKIASILSSLDDKIELNNRMNKILEEMAQTIFKEWFVNFNFPNEEGKPYKDSGGKMIESELGAIPDGWEITNLDYIVKVIKGKKPKEISSKKTDLLSSQYLTIDCYNNSNIEYTEYIEKMYVNKLDIIMVMDGASSGKLFYGKNGILSSTMAKFHVEDIYIKEVVFFFLKKIENEIMYHTTGSAIPHANKHFILNKKIVLPPKKLFNLINKLKMIREKIILNTEENQKLDSIRDTLLPKLMSGEIKIK